MQKINLSSKDNLSWYTISTPVSKQAKYIRPYGSECFAIVDLEIVPHLNQKIAVFKNQIAKIDCGYQVLYPLQKRDRDTCEIMNTIVTGIIQGIEKACSDSKQKPYTGGGIEVIATSAVYHPIDSRPLCYEKAVNLTLLAIFEQIDLKRA